MHQLNSKEKKEKENSLIKKQANNLHKHFSKDIMTGQQIHEKMLGVTQHY